jgi:hypothetical protein
MPALPLDEAGKYVAGAYVVFVALLLIYVAILSLRISRIDRELGELAELAESNKRGSDLPSLSSPRPAESGREAEHLGGGIR